MKNTVKTAAYIVLFLGIIIVACKKKDEIVSETVKVQYPIITLKGDKYVSIPVGGTFSDPGAEIYDDFTKEKKDLPPTQSAVDNNTPGMYPIIYEGSNKYGFKAREVRWVAVTNVPANEDIGGTYLRAATGALISVDKVATGIYKVDNLGGVAGIPDYIYDMYFVQMSDTTVNFPAQPGPYGTTYTNSEKLTKSPSDTTLAWRVIGTGFGTAIRTFSRQ